MRFSLKNLFTFFLLISISSNLIASADEYDQEFKVSPKQPWNDISNMPQEPEEGSTLGAVSDIFLYIPNRVLDLLDIFKIDLGIGPAAGAVVRVTDSAQVGARVMLPSSLRLGLMGRRAPVMLESIGELSFGPGTTSDRLVCKAELGAGVDLLLLGGYVGFCPDELIDFVGGVFLVDFKNDDL